MAFDFLKRAKVPDGSAAVINPQRVELRQRPQASVKQSDKAFMKFFDVADNAGAEVITLDSALSIPAVGAAVNFLARTLASVPIKAYKKGPNGREVVQNDPVAALFNYAANEETNSFEARRNLWHNFFTMGRMLAFIERNGRDQVINLWPLDPDHMTINRVNNRKKYYYQDGGRTIPYAASEIIDLSFAPGGDGLSSRSPIFDNAPTIGLALAVTRYGARFFNNGGIPPFAIEGSMKTAGGVSRAVDDLSAAVLRMTEERRNAIALPEGHKIVTLGVDPEKMQMVDVQRFLIEQIARIYTIPPAFLQDLTNGTFSNVEQQDLQLVKHLIAPHQTHFEKEINLKIYGRATLLTYLEGSLDALARGDLKSRAEGIAAQINSGQLTLNEAREIANRQALEGGDVLLVQGAMMAAERLLDPARVPGLPIPPKSEGNDG